MNSFGPQNSSKVTPARSFNRFRANLRVFAGWNPVKNTRKRGKSQKSVTSPPNKPVLNENDVVSNIPPLADDNVQDNSKISPFSNSDGQTTVLVPSRGAVLQACTIPSCLIGTLGVVIRQVSHFAYTKGGQ